MKKEQRAMHLVAIEEKVASYLLTYGFNMKRKNIKEKTEALEVLIRSGSRINFRVLPKFYKKIEHRNDVICRKIIIQQESSR